MDEDCDPTTVGIRDADEDGFVAAECCNAAADGSGRCGTDCDDTLSGVHPGVPEVCNGLDDDCDGPVDEDVQLTLYPDTTLTPTGTASAIRRRPPSAPAS